MPQKCKSNVLFIEPELFFKNIYHSKIITALSNKYFKIFDNSVLNKKKCWADYF